MMRTTAGLLTLIVSASALRFAPEVPDQSLAKAAYDEASINLMRDADGCTDHLQNLLGGIETYFNEGQTSRLQKAFSDPADPTDLRILAVGTKHTVCLGDNWLEHAVKAHNQPTLFVHVSLDEEAQASCVKDFQPKGGAMHKVKCVDLSDALHWSDLRETKASAGCVYNLIVWMKPLIMKAVTTSLADSSSVLLMDTDIIVHRDLRQLLAEGRTSMVQFQNEAYGLPNTGLFNINRNASEFMHGWMKEALTSYLDKKPTQLAIKKFLTSEEGTPFKNDMRLFKTNQVNKCGRKAEYATHYNCLPAGKKKILMQEHGSWNATSGKCSGAGELSLSKQSSLFDQELADLILSEGDQEIP